jgi:hypothetical protein
MDVENMTVCHFRATKNDEITTYLPGEIFGYRFYDIKKFYVSKEIVTNDVPRTVFLEFLVKGMLNLYYYVDVDGIMYYFFEDQTGKMTPITKIPDREVRIEGHGLSQFRQDFRYRGAIQYFFNDQTEMSRSVNRVRFDQTSMINLATEYHDLTCPIGKECVVFVGKKTSEFTQFNFSLYGGVQLYSDHYIDIFAPMIGAKISISNSRIIRNMSFQADVSISKIQGTATAI